MIGWVRKAVSDLSYYSGLSSLLYRLGSRKTVILVYHRIANKEDESSLDREVISANPKNFERQMRFLKERYNVISLDEFLECLRRKTPPKKNSVVITFDDGYKDNYNNAYPILMKHGLPATIFLSTEAISSREMFWWDKVAYVINRTEARGFRLGGLGRFRLCRKGDRPRAIRKISSKLKYMDEAGKNLVISRLAGLLGVRIPSGEENRDLFISWAEAAKMAKNGISFGAHTITHPILTNIPPEEAEREITGSKRAIERALGRRVSSFCYPNGYSCDFNRKIKRLVKDAGFECAASYIPGKNSIYSDPYELKRIPIMYGDDMRLFRNKLVGLEVLPARIYLWLRNTIGKGRV